MKMPRGSGALPFEEHVSILDAAIQRKLKARDEAAESPETSPHGG